MVFLLERGGAAPKEGVGQPPPPPAATSVECASGCCDGRELRAEGRGERACGGGSIGGGRVVGERGRSRRDKLSESHQRGAVRWLSEGLKFSRTAATGTGRLFPQ